MWCDGAWPCSAGRPAACLGHSGALAGACKGASLLHLHLVWECRPNNPCSCALSLRTNQSTSITSHHMRPIRVLRSTRHVSRPRGCWRVIKGWWTQAPVEWVAPTWLWRSLLKAQRLQLALSSTCCQRGRQGGQTASSSSSSTSTSSKGSYCSALKSLWDAGAFVVAVH
jgi:hypothetical protein